MWRRHHPGAGRGQARTAPLQRRRRPPRRQRDPDARGRHPHPPLHVQRHRPTARTAHHRCEHLRRRRRHCRGLGRGQCDLGGLHGASIALERAGRRRGRRGWRCCPHYCCQWEDLDRGAPAQHVAARGRPPAAALDRRRRHGPRRGPGPADPGPAPGPARGGRGVGGRGAVPVLAGRALPDGAAGDGALHQQGLPRAGLQHHVLRPVLGAEPARPALQRHRGRGADGEAGGGGSWGQRFASECGGPAGGGLPRVDCKQALRRLRQPGAFGSDASLFPLSPAPVCCLPVHRDPRRHLLHHRH